MSGKEVAVRSFPYPTLGGILEKSMPKQRIQISYKTGLTDRIVDESKHGHPKNRFQRFFSGKPANSDYRSTQ